MHRDLPTAANEIAADQGWDQDSLLTHLIGFVQTHGPINWTVRLPDYLREIAREENQHNEDN